VPHNLGLELTLTLAARTLPEGETSLELMVWVLAAPPAGDVAQVTVWERAGKARRERNFEVPVHAFERLFARLNAAGYTQPRLDPADQSGDIWTSARVVITPPGYETSTFVVESTVGSYTGPDADNLRLAFAELLRVAHVGHHQAWWFLTGQPPG
jgi:hypothetical protein